MLRASRLTRRAARWLGTAGYLCLTVPLWLLLAPELLGINEQWMPLWLLAISGLALGVLSWVCLVVGWMYARARWAPTELTVRSDALILHTLQRAVVVPRDSVVGGTRRGALGGFELHLRGGDHLVGDASPDDTARLLAELSLDAPRRAVTLGTTTAVTPAFRAAWIFAALAVATGGLLHASPPRTGLLLVNTLVAWLLAVATLGPTVTVGVDGLRIRQLGVELFIAWSEVVDVTKTGALRLTLTSGEEVSLGRSNAAVETLRVRIDEARDAAATSGPMAAAARGGRSVEQWRKAMDTLLEGTGYRDGAVSEDALVGALRGGAVGDERVGAALALVAINRERHVTGVRVAAEAVADERVRVALEQIADGVADDATLKRAAR